MNKHKNPEIFHKKFYNKSYFEGWYYKQVTADRSHTISFIPGVSFEKTGSKSFIQCLHLNQTNELRSYNIDYLISDFTTWESPFDVRIHKSQFSLERIKLDVEEDKLKVFGNIKFSSLTTIKTSMINPNIMGFFSYIPFMECNHGVLSMAHNLDGYLEVNGEKIDFKGGKGYIEKDWGRSFPSNYIWIESNHFKEPSTAIFVSIAKIPFMGFKFTGYICNLIHNNVEYRFATYNGTRLVINEHLGDTVHVKFKNRKYSLEIEGETGLCKKLLAPKMGFMNKTIKEGLVGKIKIILRDNKDKIILDTESSQCGIEVVDMLQPV